MKDPFIEFFKKVREQEVTHFNDPMTAEAAFHGKYDHWGNFNRVAVKKHEHGIILVATGITSSEPVSLSASTYGLIPWWYEGEITQRLVRHVMALPDYYPQAIIEPDMSLDEIHQAQEMIDGRG